MQTIGVTVSSERSFPKELQSLKSKFIFKTIPPGQLEDTIGDCDILYFWNLVYDELDAVISNAARLPKLIYVARQGKDEWLIDRLSSTDTHIRYAQGVFSDAIAEYVLASILMLCKSLHITAMQQTWQKHDSSMVSGSNALILGRGDIAQKTKTLLESIGIESQQIGHKDVLHMANKRATKMNDIHHVICCLPYEKETENVLDINFFSHFSSVNFVNISRGEVLSIDGLVGALDGSFVRAAVLDVFREEPLNSKDALWKDERIVVSPHQSYKTLDWAHKLHESFIEYIGGLV